MDESEIKVPICQIWFSCFVPWQVLIALRWLKVEVRICSVFTDLAKDDSDLTRISPLTHTISYSFTHVYSNHHHITVNAHTRWYKHGGGGGWVGMVDVNIYIFYSIVFTRSSWTGHTPSYVVIGQRKYIHFSLIFGPTPEIKPATSRSAVKRSTD